MRKCNFGRLGLAALLVWSGYVHDAAAATQTTFFDTLNASASVAPAVSEGDTLFVDTVVTSQTGALSQSVSFIIGNGATGFTGQAAWMVSTAAGPGPRLLGFNVDIFDANHALVDSDAFGGVLGGFAHSTFGATNLAPGSYTLVATGTGVRDSLFDIALSFLGTPPVSPVAGTGGVPAQGPTTSEPTAFFSVLNDARTVTSTLGAGDTLILDTLVTSGTGPLTQSVTFTLDSGVDGITGLAGWIVTTAIGPGPRLIGVNLDLFDATTNTLVSSDTFVGVLDGVAHSTFDTPIGPGTYRLVATGTGVRDSSLDIALSFTGAPVPEPATGALIVAGLIAAGMFTPRRRASTTRRPI